MFNPVLWVVFYGVLQILRYLIRKQASKVKHRKLLDKAHAYIEDRNKKFVEFMKTHAKEIPAKNKSDLIFSCDSLAELQKGLTHGQFTSIDLLMFYINRCYNVGKKLNLISQINFEKAYEWAADCDKLRKDPNKFKERLQHCDDNGLLFGIPVSVKDHVYLKGTHNTLGCIQMLDYVHEKEGLIETQILRNGGIPFVKTNVPMLLLSMESYNRIFGRTQNPIKHNRIPGGSSGGCAAVVQSKCSPISFGTDIGGSVRGPAHFCGVYGFKPTPQRVRSLI